MQKVLSSTESLANNLAAVTLRLALYDQESFDVDIVSCRYTARASSGDDFSFGNACSSSISITIDSEQRLGIRGKLIQVLWSVDSTQHPLFTGYVTKERMDGEELVIEASDAIYTLGGTTAIPTGEEATAADCLATIAEQMSLVVESTTQTFAAALPLTMDNLPEKTTCAQALSMISGCLGGNAVITRDGLLAVRAFQTVAFSAETYSGGNTTESDGFELTGITFFRTAENEDGTTSELRFEAGDGALELENDLADQTSVDFAWASLSGITFVPGSFSIPGGIQLECGDIISVNGLPVACMDITMDIDGGVKTTVTAYGDEDTGGVTGSLNQRLDAALSGVASVQQQVAQEKKDRESAVAGLTAALASATGLYETVKTETDGSKIQYLHDKPTLAESTLVLLVNSGGIGISNDGGVTYQYGFSFTGDAILNELHAEGIYGVKIFGEEGSIGGFNMSANTLSAEFEREWPDFTQDDLDKIIAYRQGTVELTAEEIEKYDVNMNGSVDVGDSYVINQMILGGLPTYSKGRIVIDATDPKNTIRIEVTEGYRAGQSTSIGMGVLFSSFINADSFACGGVTGYTGSVSVGDVTLTITGGIITGVT